MGRQIYIATTITLLIWCVSSEASSDPVVKVQVKQGWVSGLAESWASNRTIYTFSSVPYALPPVGDRRFKDPEPMASWPGTWDASQDRGHLVQCLQYMHKVPRIAVVLGQEDCLYLSIFTPRIPTSSQTVQEHKLLDVIVYIHGGAFMYGSHHKYIPTNMMIAHNVVYVALNYRLGPFGFLSTGDDEVPGNMGLKDQTLALRWIKDNIAQFGGNPNSITLTGMSAGGASVHFHMLSSPSRGLFHKAISQSGTMLSPWTLAEDLPEKTRLIARNVGCPETTNKLMVDCLRARPAVYLADAVRLTQPFLYNPFSPWGPTVDGFARNPVLPDYPAKLMLQGKVADVPWINSVNSGEGLYPGSIFLSQPDVMDTINTNWTDLAPHILDFNFTVDPLIKEEVAAKIRSEYMKDKPITLENYKPFIQMLGDRMFKVDAERCSRFMSGVNKAPVFFYMFNFRGRLSLSNMFSRQTTNFGVCHGDDTMYILQFLRSLLINTTEEEQKTMNFMANLWVSFAAKGKPHISGWPPVRPDAFSYLQIDSGTNLTMRENVTEIGSRSFWDSLPFREHNEWPNPTEGKGLAKVEDPIVVKGLPNVETPTSENEVSTSSSQDLEKNRRQF